MDRLLRDTPTSRRATHETASEDFRRHLTNVAAPPAHARLPQTNVQLPASLHSTSPTPAQAARADSQRHLAERRFPPSVFVKPATSSSMSTHTNCPLESLSRTLPTRSPQKNHTQLNPSDSTGPRDSTRAVRQHAPSRSHPSTPAYRQPPPTGPAPRDRPYPPDLRPIPTPRSTRRFTPPCSLSRRTPVAPTALCHPPLP